MRKNRLLENLNREIGHNVSIRRYSLSDMISESYKVLYRCEEGSNLKRLAESHLSDVKNNPRDIERLSRHLGILKELVSLTESGEMKDEDLVSKEHHDTVERNKKRNIQKLHPTEEIKENKDEDLDECDTSKKEDLKEVDDPELTDEELEELAKHLETIRKERKSAPKKEITEDTEYTKDHPRKGIPCHLQDSKKEELKEDTEESRSPRKGIKCHLKDSKKEELKEDIEPKVFEISLSVLGSRESEVRDIVDELGEDLYGKGLEILGSSVIGPWTKEQYDGMYESKKELDECDESKSYKGLANFKKQSESKAFYRTFKKLDSALQEGRELTRKESIDLYKASNSALTHLSVELEHNPEFQETFKESATMLSKDVASLLESLSEGNAPSKKTMKSIAKFAEALLRESDEEDYDDYEDEEIPVEENPEDFVGDDEGDIDHEPSEEEQQYDEEYADGREELHNDLEDKFEETEDEFVQGKLDADAAEVAELKGEDIEDEELPAEEETPAEDAEEEVVDDITDDELAELKKHLTEMRLAKKNSK